MWECQVCGEELEEQFDACWKCGTPESETTPPADDFPESDSFLTAVEPDPSALLPQTLPEITYYSIPPWILSGIAIASWEIGSTKVAPDAQLFLNVTLLNMSLSPLSVGHAVVGVTLIHLPLARLLLRAGFRVMVQQDYWTTELRGGRWFLSLFRLPMSIRQRHSRFRFLYYGSLLSMCLAPFVFMGWILFLAFSRH